MNPHSFFIVILARSQLECDGGNSARTVGAEMSILIDLLTPCYLVRGVRAQQYTQMLRKTLTPTLKHRYNITTPTSERSSCGSPRTLALVTAIRECPKIIEQSVGKSGGQCSE